MSCRRAADPDPVTPTGAFYDSVWETYGSLHSHNPAGRHRRRLIIERLAGRIHDGERMLDVGCGEGELLSELASAFPALLLHGTDVSPRSLADTAARCPGVELFLLDLETSDFEVEHETRLGLYQLVICSEVLEHLPDDSRAARRLGALLAPGGWLVLTVPGGRPTRFDLAIGHQRHYRRGDLTRVIQSAGLEVVELSAWGFPFHTAYRAAVRWASRFALPAGPADASPGDGSSRLLARAYAMVARLMDPLFSLNLSRWGEQWIAVARRPPAVPT